jgi:hypothetical protein
MVELKFSIRGHGGCDHDTEKIIVNNSKIVTSMTNYENDDSYQDDDADDQR